MADMRVLDAEAAMMVERVCDAIVPGSARVRPAVYVDALLARMEEGTRAGALAAFAFVADGEIGDKPGTQEFAWVRALAIEAFYSDFVAPGRRRAREPGRRSTSTHLSPRVWRRTGPTWGSGDASASTSSSSARARVAGWWPASSPTRGAACSCSSSGLT